MRPRKEMMLIDGAPLKTGSVRDAIKAGIVYLTEDRKGLGLFLDMSVHDNINTMVLAGDARFRWDRRFWQDERARKACHPVAVDQGPQCCEPGRIVVGWKPAEGAPLPLAAAEAESDDTG
jgi:ABC-type sugar transport system ATPase subunit